MTSSTSPDAPAWRNPLLIGGVIVLAVIAGILLTMLITRSPETGGGPSVSPTPSPAGTESAASSETPVASPEPSDEPASTEEAGPTPVVEAPDGVLPPGSVARVTVDALRVREGPTTESEEVTSLASGDLVVLGYSYLNPTFGPTEAEGLTWYPVGVLGMTELPEPGHEPFEQGDIGWAAVSDGSDDFVELVAPRCVDGDPDLALLQSLTEWERLACYGDRSITLEGVMGCGGCGGLFPGTFEPAWLATPMNYDFLSVEPQDRLGPFLLYWSPDGPERADTASILRVTGHFDDAAAGDCVIAPGEPEQIEIDQVVAALYCREHFVVESYEVLGIDEDFQFG